MIDLSVIFKENLNENEEKAILFQQRGKEVLIDASDDGIHSEICEDVEGMNLYIFNKMYRKSISTPNVSNDMLTKLFEILRENDKSVNLKSKNPKNKIEDSSLESVKKIYFDVLELFNKHGIKFNINIQMNDIDKRIYREDKLGYIEKKEKRRGIMIKYKIEKRKHSFFRTFKDVYDRSWIYNLNEELNSQINSEYLKIESGKYPILLEAGTTAILFHEICGHLFEATKENSIFNKLKDNELITNEKITVIDDDFVIEEKEEFDDDGNEKKKIKIIDNGKYNKLISDRYSSYKNGIDKTGNGRRRSYENITESRMFCTYIENGDYDSEHIKKAFKKGIIVKNLGESYVKHSTGDFECFIEEACFIEDGKVCGRIHGVKIKDKATEFLKNIRFVGNDLKTIPIYCNSSSGLIYVECGSPTIVVDNIKIS